jgi:hypothetical protein
MEVALQIREVSRGHRFMLMQNGRAPETGIDVAWVYLLYWAGVNEQLTGAVQESDRLFVIRDHSARLRPEIEAFLEKMPHDAYTHTTLYLVPQDFQEQWLETLQRFPVPVKN